MSHSTALKVLYQRLISTSWRYALSSVPPPLTLPSQEHRERPLSAWPCSTSLCAAADQCTRLFSAIIALLGPQLGTKALSALAGRVSPGGTVWEQTREGLLQRLNDADLVIVGHIHTPWLHEDERGSVLVLKPGEPVQINDGSLVTAPHG